MLELLSRKERNAMKHSITFLPLALCLSLQLSCNGGENRDDADAPSDVTPDEPAPDLMDLTDLPEGSDGEPDVTDARPDADAADPTGDPDVEDGMDAEAAWRPFADTSIWNTPIAPDAPIHAGSDGMIGTIAAHGSWHINGIEWAWSIPLYFSGDADPLQNTCSGSLGTFALHIPEGAFPSPDSDADFAVVDRLTTPWTVFSAWSTSFGGDPGCDYTSEAAGWLPDDGDGLTMEGWGGRATGWSYVAGLIRPEEILQGHIDHALVFAMSDCKTDEFWWPASWGDGSSSDPNAVPQGARVQLSPDVAVGSLGLSPGGEVIARALQVYGAFLGDTSGGSVLYAQEFLLSDGSCCDAGPWEAVLDPTDIEGLPLDQLRVLEPPEPP
jgi:hypothetical protein